MNREITNTRPACWTDVCHLVAEINAWDKNNSKRLSLSPTSLNSNTMSYNEIFLRHLHNRKLFSHVAVIGKGIYFYFFFFCDSFGFAFLSYNKENLFRLYQFSWISKLHQISCPIELHILLFIYFCNFYRNMQKKLFFGLN